jgi:queuosine precursor transporter
MNKRTVFYVSLYLLAIILANFSVFYFGVNAAYVNAFLFIGLDLTSRDSLHEIWNNENLFLKMLVLVFSGSFISFLLNTDAYNIALASFLAFFVAGMVDYVIYKILHNHNRMVKINGSNIFGSMTDSLIFPTIAFGGFSIVVTLGQFLAKVLGGFFWSLIIDQIDKRWFKVYASYTVENSL